MLSVHLEYLEDHYTILFNYNRAIIDSYTIEVKKKENLKEYLYEIRSQTGLTIVKASSYKYIIYKKEQAKIKHEELSQILLVGYLNKGVNQYKDGSFSVNTGSSRLFPGLSSPDVLHTIQTLPGIQSIDESISNLNIRGSSNDQNLVLWNGIQMYQTGHFFGLISAFNTYPPHEVKVSKHLSDSRYTGAVSGIITMDYLVADKKKSEFGAGVDFVAAHAYGNWAVNDKINVQFSLRKSITEFMDTPTYEVYKNRMIQGTDLDANAQMNFKFLDASLGLSMELTDRDQLDFYGILFENDLDYQNNTDQLITSNIKQNHYATGYNYVKEISDDLILEHTSYFTSYELNSILENNSANSSLSQRNRVRDFGTSLKATLKINEQLNFTSGLETSQVSVFDNEVVIQPDLSNKRISATTNHEFFLQAQYSNRLKTLDVSTGMRWSYLPFYHQLLWEPRLNVSYQLSKNYQLITNIQQTNQNIFQIIDEPADFQGLEKRRWRLSDNDTNPIIQAQQASLAFQRNESGLLIGIEGYYKKITNTLSGSQTFSGVFRDRNAVGETTSLGIEFVVNKKFRNWSTWLSYHFNDSHSRFQEVNNNTSFPNSFNIQHYMNLSAVYTYEDWEFAAGLNYHNGVRYTPVSDLNQSVNTNEQIEYQSTNSATLPYYFRTDVSIHRNFSFDNNSKLLLTASLLNLFNRTNVNNTFYQAGENRQIEAVVQESLGTVFNMSARIIFK